MDTSEQPERIADDLLVGASKIADELGVSTRAVYHIVRTKRLPIGKLGKNLVASRRSLRRAAHLPAHSHLKGKSKMPIALKNTASVLPYIRYSPQANSMTVAGEDNVAREILFLGKSFAADPENGSPGWLLIGEGVPRLATFSARRCRAAFPRSQLQARLLNTVLRAKAPGQP